jgi:hypothetical protein
MNIEHLSKQLSAYGSVVPYPPAWKPYGLEAGTESSRKPG